MARRDLLAGDRSGTFANANTAYIYGSIYTALHTGIADRVVVRAGSGAGEVKFSLYDSSGNLLFSDETGSAIGAVSDWVNFDGYNVPVSGAVVYRLGLQGNNSGTFTRTDTAADTGFITSHAYVNPFPDPISLGGARNYEAAIEFSGFIAPSIINIDGDNSIGTTQTNVVLAGLDLLDSTGNATLTLWENSDFTGASQLQTWKSQTDTTLIFDVVLGSLSTGTVYAEVKTGLLQTNVTAHAVTLVGAVTDVVATVRMERAPREMDMGVTLSVVSTVEAERGSREAWVDGAFSVTSTVEAERGSREAGIDSVLSVVSTIEAKRGSREAGINGASSVVSTIEAERGSREATVNGILSVRPTIEAFRAARGFDLVAESTVTSTIGMERASRTWGSSIIIDTPGVVVATIRMERAARAFDASTGLSCSVRLEASRAGRDATVSAGPKVFSEIVAERGARVFELSTSPTVSSSIEAERAARGWESGILQTVLATVAGIRAGRGWESEIVVYSGGDVVATIRMERGARDFLTSIVSGYLIDRGALHLTLDDTPLYIELDDTPIKIEV